MANIKSAKKRILVTAKKTLRNKMVKTRTKSAIKGVVTAVAQNDASKANEALQVAIRVIDKATTKGIFHKNNGSRKKSRLTKLVNKMSA